MKKLSSYQKLKAENQRLKHDIYNLVMRDHEWEGFSIRVNYRFRFGKEGAIWYRASEMPEPGIGLRGQIK